ncbi:hypothetical protein CUMW_208020 [Citrus unshiu]|nr:hypothetical protein CUMW_208020 [Citrus unshiu]
MGFSSYSQQAFSLLVLFITSVKGIDATNRVFNVKDFGAAADGIKDDSKAFGTAWREACNWDGIEARSNGIEISHSVIATGDDCVSLGQGSKNILVSDVFFGPGHGISVGSLGKDTKDEEVVGLTVRNCTFTGTSNGVRVKT